MMERIAMMQGVAVMEGITAMMERIAVVQGVVVVTEAVAAVITAVAEAVAAVVATTTMMAGIGHHKQGIVQYVVERRRELAEAVEGGFIDRVCHIGIGGHAGRGIGSNGAVGASDERGAGQEGGPEEGRYAFDHHHRQPCSTPTGRWTDIARGVGLLPRIVERSPRRQG